MTSASWSLCIGGVRWNSGGFPTVTTAPVLIDIDDITSLSFIGDISL